MDIAVRRDFRLLGAALVGVAAVTTSILFIDRPTATWSHGVLHGARIFRDLTHIVDPVLPVSALGLAIAAIASANGWRPGPIGRTFLTCCLAALVAHAVKDQAKFAFGRLWPETWTNDNPSWIRDGAYGFVPFHGGTGWSSFPSGHMTDITAPVAVLWRRLPRWRPLLIVPVALVAIGLYGADFHFLGDMIAGLMLGAACGAGILALLPTGRAPSGATGPVN